LAFKLFERIASEFGSELPANVLVEASTLGALAARIDSGEIPNRRLVRVHADGSRLPCVYVHAGAGGLFTLRSFAAALGPEQPLYGIQAFTDRQTSNNRLAPVDE